MTKWTWLEWLQPDVCSYDIIVAPGHSEECVQPEAQKGRLRWKVLWSAVDHGFSASRKHQEDPSQWRKNLEGSSSNLPPQPVTPDVTSRSVSTLRSRRLGALLTEDWAIMIRSAWWEFGVWDKFLEFVSIIWPTGNGGVKPTIINLSTCCKWTKSLIKPRVAQCFVVNIGGGEMLVRKDELPLTLGD